LKQNAAAVTTSKGGGVHGYLGIILSDAMYANIAPGAPFEAPDFPGNQPNIPGGATGPQIAEIVRNHTEQLREWHEHNHVAAALRLQIVKSMEAVYLRSQLDRHVGFANKTPRTLITYLFDSYGRITPQRLAENHQVFPNLGIPMHLSKTSSIKLKLPKTWPTMATNLTAHGPSNP
jgi:hypothetical protein